MVFLDASALLALLLDEPVVADIETHLADALLLSVNLIEVVAALTRRGLRREHINDALTPLALPVVPFTEEMAWLAGVRRAQMPSALGLADCCCLAAAASQSAAAVTTDAFWQQAGRIFAVEVVYVSRDDSHRR